MSAGARRLTAGLCIAAASAVCSIVSLSGCAPGDHDTPTMTLQQRVFEVERAFARTMAERDHDGFTSFLADEAIFFAGSEPLRGKAAVAAAWKPFFDGPSAPFAWAPDQVEVLESGSLALSTGPVFDPQGRVTARFQSIWRQEPDGTWRIVFDKGTPACRCPQPS